MKNIIILLVYVSCLNLFSQNSKEFLNELNKLRGAELSEISSLEGLSPNVRAAELSNVRANYQRAESDLRLKYDIEEQKKSYKQQTYNSIDGDLMLQKMQQQQYDTQNRYRQNINNTLSSLSGSLQAMAYRNIERN